MRILFITNKFPSKSETFIATKILGLAARGHEVMICCSAFNREDLSTPLSNNISIQIICKKSLLEYAIRHPMQAWQYVRKTTKLSDNFLIHIAKKFNPDITHFVFSGLGVLYLEAIKKLPGKIVVSCRGSGEKLMPILQTDRSEKMKTLFDLVHAIHCVSEDMRQTILPYCKNPAKIFIQYTGINTAVFVPDRKATTNTIFTILTVGRLSLQKGYITGMHIMYKLKKAGYHFKWIIVGDGPQKLEVKYHSHFMALNDVIEFVGAKNQQEIIAYYKVADLFFLPSIYEGVSNAAIEAMCMKLPVVCTKSGGMQEVIVDGKNGFVSEVGDVDTMYNCIIKIMSDELLGKQIGESAYHSVVDKFTTANYVNGFEKSYQALNKKNR